MKNEDMKTVAKAFFQEKDFESAIDICLDIIKENEFDHEAYTIMGECYFEKGMKECAEELFRKAWECDSKDFRSGYRFALSQLNQKKIDEACRTFESLEDLCENQEDFSLLMSELSELYFVKKDYVRAEEKIRKALEYSSNNVKYLQGLARLLYAKEEYARAEEVFDQIINEQENIDVDHITLMKIYIALGKYSKAALFAETVVDPVNTDYFNTLKAFIHLMEKDEQAFMDTMNIIYPELEEYDDIYISIENHIFTLMKYEEFDKVIRICSDYSERFDEEYLIRLELLKKACEIMTDNPDWKNGLEDISNTVSGIIQYSLQAGMYDIAYIISEKLENDHDVDASMLYYYQYVMNRDNEDYEKAMEKLELAIKTGEREEFYIELVTLLNETGNSDKSLDIITGRLKKTDNHDFIMTYNEILGDIFFDDGDFKSAKDKYLSVYENGKDEFVTIKLAECFFNLDELDNAESVLEENIRLNTLQEYMLLDARIKNRKEMTDQAVDIYGRLIKEYPDYYIPYIDMANILVDKGEIDAARNILKKAGRLPELSDEEKDYIKYYLGQIE